MSLTDELEPPHRDRRLDSNVFDSNRLPPLALR
jgi:hypothetical protein